jgi:ATP-dependent DNA ligase
VAADRPRLDSGVRATYFHGGMSAFPELRRRLVRRASSFESCLPRLAKIPPTGEGWIHEIKHDGFRVIAGRDGHRVRLTVGTAAISPTVSHSSPQQ